MEEVLLQGLVEAMTAAGVITVMLPLVLLVFLVFPLVERVQSTVGCCEQRESVCVCVVILKLDCTLKLCMMNVYNCHNAKVYFPTL